MNPPRKESPAKPADAPQSAKCCDCDRRGFFKKSLAVVIGGVITLIPAAAGLMVLLDPLRRKATLNTDPVKVTTLAALPDDGVPRKFPVLADKVDAWNKYRDVPIGAVYLRRTSDGKIEALNVVCPHAGCFVDYSSDRNKFVCPCHNSSFALDGKIADPKSPSPRALDTLAVEVRNNNEVWVTFENFQAGRPDKVPVA
jgi:menaquinol-cytochrome c reductase iron-sulfur subunit